MTGRHRPLPLQLCVLLYQSVYTKQVGFIFVPSSVQDSIDALSLLCKSVQHGSGNSSAQTNMQDRLESDLRAL